MTTISILGCGWLGFPLAGRCIQANFTVKGSSTTMAKLAALENASIVPYLLTYSPLAQHDPRDFFDGDTLFLNIPFRRNLAEPAYYYDQIKSVMGDVQRGSIDQLIFSSSTSIYPDSIGLAKEEDNLRPDNERSCILFDIERMLLQRFHNTTIVRFGGLVGGERQIGRFLAGKTDLDEPDRPVNLIHLEDCLGIVLRLIQRPVPGAIFNAVCDAHPRRAELYAYHAEKAGLKPPQFNKTASHGSYKIVSNEKIKKELGYTFQYPDPYLFPRA